MSRARRLGAPLLTGAAVSSHSVLDAALLERIRGRASGYDEDNRFFQEHLENLRVDGYLKPHSLNQMVADQRLLAAHAPATALGLGMHLTWRGVAQTLAAEGEDSLRLHGGRGFKPSSKISRSQRDVLAGANYPSDTESVHHTVAFALLGSEAP